MSWIVLLGCILIENTLGKHSIVSNLTRDVFDGYVPTVRPYCNGSSFISVGTRMHTRKILDVDELMQNIKVHARVSLEWKDCLLHWDPKLYDDIKYITVPYERIFVPDVSFSERIADMKSYGIKDFRATVFYDGRIQQTFATTIAVPCNLNPVNTPFDEQSCVLRYGSWTFNKDEIDLQLIAEFEDTSELQKQVLWQVTKIKAVRVETYDQPVGWVAEIDYSINLKRKPYYFLRKILEPTIIIAFVGTFAFLLPVQSGEKIMLVINTLHALTLYQTVLAENTPRSSKEMPKLTNYFIILLVNSAVAVLIQCIVITIYYKKEKMPAFVQRFILKPSLALCTFVFNREKLDFKIHSMGHQRIWQTLSRCIDIIGFVLNVLVIVIGGVYIIYVQILLS